nr:PREDICTED: uncharacterized protein C7orf72 homolog [Anolis carolinensis]|eukprot:XP_016850168.1 PREDICTED: uncharacterized protein C7orf72 homolog [Anolis carolinensis]
MMASHVTTRQFSPFKHSSLHSDSLHKVHKNQYERLLKRMYMPFVRGPEDRHLFPSFTEKCSSAFLKSNPFIPPEDKSYILAPHREDEPELSSFSGFLSPAAEAEADKQIPRRKNIELQSSGKDVQPPQETPAPHQKDQIAKKSTSLLLEYISQDQRWNSRAVPDSCLRAKIGGSTSPVKVRPAQPKTKDSFSSHSFEFHVDPDVKVILFTDIDSADYINLACILKVVGSLWSRFQRRPFIVPHRPINL